MADESQVFGIGAEVTQVAKVAAAGGFGAWVLIYFRHPGSLLKATILVSIGIGIASIFAGPVSHWIGMGEVQSAALLGLTGKAIAESALKAIEKVDFGQWLANRRIQGD